MGQDAKTDAAGRFRSTVLQRSGTGLVAPGYLQGNEEVVVLNTTSVPRLAFRLPGCPPADVPGRIARRQDIQLQTNLDTVIVNTDEQQLILLWRACTLIGGGPHDVTAIAVDAHELSHGHYPFVSSTSTYIGNISTKRRSCTTKDWPTCTIPK